MSPALPGYGGQVVADRRELVILDVLFALTLAGQVTVLLLLWDPVSAWRAIVYAVDLAIIVALWLYWRSHDGAAWVPVALAVASLVAVVLGDGLTSLLLACFAVALLVVSRGPLSGIVLGVAILAAAAATMLAVYGQPVAYTAEQVVAAGVVLAMVWLIALLLRLVVTASQEAQAARRALEQSFEAEKEVLLAEERAREAGELHDGLGHRLTAIGLLLTGAERLRESDPDRAWRTIAEARAAASEALTDMRTWVRAMHPTPLEDLEDGTAFQTLADRFRGSGLSVEVSTDISKLSPETALVVRRCVQEGLTNVVRHAHARRARVQIGQDAGQVRVAISDDGHGAAPGMHGFGLAQLRARVEELGGTLTTGRSQLGGLLLEVAMPA